ncbi:MAG: serine/threonine protein kinase, partial [Myxococcales bacterium]|nr:serine/threonine protein kinase [Myxococcales bacterium]
MSIRTDGIEPTIRRSDLALDATLRGDLRESPRVGPRDREEPQQIGRYRVLRRLGAGGMGVVYAAYDTELDRKIAVKLVRPEASEVGREARLLREARAMARLSHANVIQVYDVGTLGDQVFVAMEFVDGQTLIAWLGARRRRLRAILSVFRQAAAGLSAAHEVGLVHRDFKPENVMVTRDGRVLVLDFGLARQSSGTVKEIDEGDIPATEPRDVDALDETAISRESMDLALTRTGALLGTPAYMAPEQHLGRAADARSDQFSLCVALWEALYGERPFAGETYAQLAMAVIHGERREPTARRVPRWVREVVERGLAIEPRERWPSMDALRHELAHDTVVRRRRFLGTLAIIGLATTGGVALSRLDAPAAPCQDSADQIARVWGDTARESVGAVFHHSERPFAAASWRRVVQILDRYAAGWATAHDDACAATHLRHEQSGELLDLRMSCLDRRRADLSALVERLQGADDGMIMHAVEAAANLPPVLGCDDITALTARVPPPEDLAVRERVREVQRS